MSNLESNEWPTPSNRTRIWPKRKLSTSHMIRAVCWVGSAAVAVGQPSAPPHNRDSAIGRAHSLSWHNTTLRTPGRTSHRHYCVSLLFGRYILCDITASSSLYIVLHRQCWLGSQLESLPWLNFKLINFTSELPEISWSQLFQDLSTHLQDVRSKTTTPDPRHGGHEPTVLGRVSGHSLEPVISKCPGQTPVLLNIKTPCPGYLG